MEIKHNLKIDGAKLKKVEIDYDSDTVTAIYEKNKWIPKNGEFATLECVYGKIISIVKREYNGKRVKSHVFLGTAGTLFVNNMSEFCVHKEDKIRPSTIEEKELLLSKLAEQGKVWNPEKKCVEDFYIPKNGEFCLSSYSDGGGGSSWIHIVKDASNVSKYNNRITNHLSLFTKSNNGNKCPFFKYDNYQNAQLDVFRPATNKEIALLLSELAKDGKAWDFSTKTIINLPK